ncbi:Histone deacetylase 5 [Rhynchospora pubera]|uniref:Histone deacetylase 5 n=1 Tax=Rhynchospora pubera TaxID=906938 RepID=A0AAV8D8I0_9POAL|nr:Histone deacetylase 5 [Rhynchospora pubera]
MSAPCCGARDKNAPQDAIWKTVPHRLIFAGSSRLWGAGGCAFLHPESDPNEKSHVCIYKITLEQFNDILFQENYRVEDISVMLHAASPLINLSDIEQLSKKKSLTIEALKSRSYNTIVQLGMEENLPILTLTCASSDIDRCKSGEIPLSPPPPKYANVLIKGLVEGKQLTEAEALDYINVATSKKL